MTKYFQYQTETALELARKSFRNLETTEIYYREAPLHAIIASIKDYLAAEGRTLRALDPTGQSTDRQIANRIEQASNRIRVLGARKDFADFETTDINYVEGVVTKIQNQIKAALAKAGEDLSVLDPTGKSTSAQMEQRLRQAAHRICFRKNPARLKHLEHAREAFDRIKSTTTGELIGLDKMSLKDHLDQAGATVAALDPTGRSTDAQMQAALDSALTRGHYLAAAKTLERMAKNPDDPLIGVDRIILKAHLEDAGAIKTAANDPLSNAQKKSSKYYEGPRGPF